MKRLVPLLLVMLTTVSAHASEKIIPGSGHVVGGNGTFFRTDVRILNLSSGTTTIQISYLPGGVDNTAALTVPVEVQARASVQVDDILGSLFAVTSGTGAIRLTSDGDFVAASRTWTPSDDCPGSFGQFVPALDASAATANAVITFVQLSASGSTGSRTNAGFVNPSPSPVTIDVRLRDGDGSILGSAKIDLLRWGSAQSSVAELFGVSTLTTTNAFIEVQASAPVLAYGSSIDNQSGDSIYIPAEPDTGTPDAAIEMTAQRWVFTPSTLEVPVDQPVTVRVRSIDIDHGISFSGVGPFICTTEEAGQCILHPNQTASVTFTPHSKGTFAFFCIRFCGESIDGSEGHGTMRGTLVVK